MMKTQNTAKKYVSPAWELVVTDADDIIATSELLGEGDYRLPNIKVI